METKQAWLQVERILLFEFKSRGIWVLAPSLIGPGFCLLDLSLIRDLNSARPVELGPINYSPKAKRKQDRQPCIQSSKSTLNKKISQPPYS
jgi:hypothetical protein